MTDTSKYLCGELKEGQGVFFDDLAHMEKLPELVRDLLADDARREEIVRAGIPVVAGKPGKRSRSDHHSSGCGALGKDCHPPP